MGALTNRVVTRARGLGVNVLTHDQWGSKRKTVYAVRERSRPVRIKKADTVANHITVTRDTGELVGHFKTDMQTVERIGYERFKSGVSYNFVIDNEGNVGVGMPLEAKGTHTVNNKGRANFSYDQNHAARAIAWLAMPGQAFSPKARDAWVKLTAAMMLENAITSDPDYLPHSYFAAKDCPTNAVRNQLPSMLKEAQAIYNKVKAGGQTKPAPVPPKEPVGTPAQDHLTQMMHDLRGARNVAHRTSKNPVKKWRCSLAVVRMKAIPGFKDDGKATPAPKGVTMNQLLISARGAGFRARNADPKITKALNQVIYLLPQIPDWKYSKV